MTDRGVVWAVTVLLLTATGCGGGGGAGGGGGGGASETWSGTFSGTALGPFICLAGTDGWYDESASVTFDVGGTLSTRLQASGTADFAGTFSGAETAHEASGTGCAPPPSVSSTSLGATAVNVHKVGAQLQVSAASVIIPAHFSNGGTSWALDASKLVLDPATIGTARVTGSWYGVAWSYGSPVLANGTFVLDRVASAPPVPTGIVAARGAGEVTVSWTTSPTATSYRVYWGTATGVGPGHGTVAGGITTTTYTVTGLAAGTPYFFVVTALNSIGESAPSAEVSATPAAAPPPVSEFFAVDATTQKLLVFPRTANGNVAPARSITGVPIQYAMSVDPVHSEVAIMDASGVVRTYDAGASGSAAPLRTLNTVGGTAMRVDPVNDEIAVASNKSVVVYGRTATGSAAPLRTLQVLPNDGSSTYLYAITVDPANDELLAVSALSTAAPVVVHVFARTASGSATELRSLTAGPSQATAWAGVAVDPANDEIWVTYTGDTSATRVFSRTATGAAAPLRSGAGGTRIFLDVAHGEVGISTANAIQVLSRTGLAALRAITGASTGLTDVRGVDGGP